MIDMNELRPILESMGEAVTADVIDQISAIDREITPDQKAIDDLNAEWNRRYREAFFGRNDNGDAQAATQTGDAVTVPEDNPAEPEEPMNYEDLFSEEEK